MKLVDFVRQLTKIMVENQLSEKDVNIAIATKDQTIPDIVDLQYNVFDNSVDIVIQ